MTSVYASIDKSAPGHVVIVAINKNAKATSTNVVMSGTTAGHAAVYTLTSDSALPQAAAGLTATTTTTGGATFSYVMPAQSVSVLVPSP
jgi:O-glycosyl hydrolase